MSREQLDMFGGSVDHDEHVRPVGQAGRGRVGASGESGEQLGWSLDGGAPGQLALGGEVADTCRVCPQGLEEWIKPSGVVHWRVEDGRTGAALVVVHARRAEDACEAAQEWLRRAKWPRRDWKHGHVAARRCFGCGEWWRIKGVRPVREHDGGA